MNLRIRRRRHEAATTVIDAPTHQMTSVFDDSVCRFVLACTCGAHYDTRYIDEALELRELHLAMAPLIDELEG
jgi:hypothetical protein